MRFARKFQTEMIGLYLKESFGFQIWLRSLKEQVLFQVREAVGAGTHNTVGGIVYEV